MINIFNLFWIIPVAVLIGCISTALCIVHRTIDMEDELWQDRHET